MDIQLLSDQVVQYLTPFLPYLLKGGIEAGKSAAGKLGEEFSEDAWEKAKAFWIKLRAKVETKPAANEATQDALQSPEDPDALAALRLQIKKLLLEDEGFAQVVATLVQSPETPVSKTEIHQQAGDNAIQVGTARDVKIQR